MKKSITILLALSILLLSFNKEQKDAWTLDNMHSQLGFAVSMLGIADINGTFKIADATLTTTGDDFSNAEVTLTLDVKSIDTDNDDRDKHLQTVDFFDVAKYPTARFNSKSFTKSGTDTYSISGELTLHGITKTVTWTAVGKKAAHPMSAKPLVGFRVTGTINRREFGISPSTPAEMLADEIRVVANVQFIKD